ncbi:epoxyqueuosine reductase [Desulfobacula sp.]|uniref:epoxyqueuosine reductase n=1 Tax=Desulfobacula sp. TaxID=2593537 RepID=UPI002613D0B6|nr:epoxyqueuosine reductase [Desulfobacula sp.]
MNMLSSSELTRKIIDKAKSLGASLAGVASIESLKNSPSHKLYPKIGMNLNEHFADTKEDLNIANVFWPADAVSAVVIGIEHKAEEAHLDWWDGKGTPGNRILIKTNNTLSEWIENTFPVKTYNLPYFVEKGGIFLKDAAVIAGLGYIGKNNLVITPEYGPRIRFRALLLNKKATSTGPLEFNPCENCGQPCRKACPANAFQTTVYSAKDLGQSILPGINGTYDRVSCNIKMDKDIDEAAMMIPAHDKNQQEIRQLIEEFEKSHIKTPNGDQPFKYCVKYCRKCELSCPVGLPARP